MKPLFFAAIILLFLGCGTPIYVTTTTAPTEEEVPAEGVTETNYQVFYDQLGPYGNWIDYPDYGYVWHPNVDADFRPYATNGHWVYNDEGWVWVSNYNWGWAPFHYGRWFFDDNYGWLWMPGHEWAPAWVTWGRTADYYCWAPLTPNADPDNWTPRQRDWNFVPGKRVTRPDLDKYVVNNTTIVNQQITIINNTTRANNDHNRYGRNGNIQVGIDNGRGGNNNNPNNYNRGNDNRGNDNRANDNRGNDNRGNDNRGNDNRGNDNRGNINNPNNPANNNPNIPGRNANNPPGNNNNPNNGNNNARNNNNPPNNNPGNQPVQGGFNRGNNNPPNNPQPAPPSKYNRGPVINQVENATNNRVQPMNIRDKNQPGQSTVNPNTRTVTMFRPRVVPQQQNPNGQRPAPGKVDSYKRQQKNDQ